jgi:hypothetical protein
MRSVRLCARSPLQSWEGVDPAARGCALVWRLRIRRCRSSEVGTNATFRSPEGFANGYFVPVQRPSSGSDRNFGACHESRDSSTRNVRGRTMFSKRGSRSRPIIRGRRLTICALGASGEALVSRLARGAVQSRGSINFCRCGSSLSIRPHVFPKYEPTASRAYSGRLTTVRLQMNLDREGA